MRPCFLREGIQMKGTYVTHVITTPPPPLVCVSVPALGRAAASAAPLQTHCNSDGCQGNVAVASTLPALVVVGGLGGAISRPSHMTCPTPFPSIVSLGWHSAGWALFYHRPPAQSDASSWGDPELAMISSTSSSSSMTASSSSTSHQHHRGADRSGSRRLCCCVGFPCLCFGTGLHAFTFRDSLIYGTLARFSS